MAANDITITMNVMVVSIYNAQIPFHSMILSSCPQTSINQSVNHISHFHRPFEHFSKINPSFKSYKSHVNKLDHIMSPCY